MTHADDDGMILPPRIAPSHVVILPITPKEETKQAVLEAAAMLNDKIAAQRYADESIRVEVDRRDIGGGAKNWEWIKRGVPIRIEIGPRDLSAGTVALSRRDQPVKDKVFKPSAEIVDQLPAILGEIQQNLYDRAKMLRDSNTVRIDSNFYDFFTPGNKEKPEIHGGFALAHHGSSASPGPLGQITPGLARCAGQVPADVPVGMHLCYGDAGHQHFKQPESLAVQVQVANAVTSAASRPVNWFSFTVPQAQRDSDYFAPLADLRTGPETELYFALVPYYPARQAAGTTAQQVAHIEAHLAKSLAGSRDWGICTECGMGRVQAGDVPTLLDLHRTVLDSHGANR